MTSRFFAPEVVQASDIDCGPAALKCLLEGFHVPISYGRLREACQTDVDGTSIDTLEDIAMDLGLDAEQVMLPADHLLRVETLPAIAVVDLPNGFKHFVVLWRRVGRLVQVMDPAGGRRWVDRARLADDLYVHQALVATETFRSYAASDEFVLPLRARLHAIGAKDARRCVASALEDSAVASIAALDAAARMVEALCRGGVVRRGRAATRLVERIAARAVCDPGAVPDEYWAARPTMDHAQVRLSGIVLLRVHGIATALTERRALPPELLAALEEPPRRPLRELVSFLRADGLLAPAALAGALLLGALGVIVEGLAYRGLLEVGETLGVAEQRAGVGALLLAFVLGLALLAWPVGAITMRLGRRLEGRLRIAFLGKIPRLTDRYFHSRLTSDMAQRAHAVHLLRRFPALGVELVRSVFALAATVAGVLWLDPANAPIVLGVAALSIGLPLATQAVLNERDLKVSTHVGALTRFYLDALLGLVPIRAHEAERSIRREHEGLLVSWERASLDLLRASVTVETIGALLGLTLSAVLLASYLARGGAVGGVLLLVYWALAIPAIGQQIATTARQYPSMRSTALRLLEPLDAPEGASPSHVSEPRPGPVAIAFERVTVRAGGHVILEDVSLSVRAGEKIAIVGPSGAGKSSLLGVLLGWHSPSEGRVTVDGAPLDPASLAQLRSETAWVDPAVQLWNRSLVANLRYGAHPSAGSTGRALHDADLFGVLERLPEGLSASLGEGGALVSGGEGQRVRFGRALMRPAARLVLLDEPFRGLDGGARRRLLARAIDRFDGATVLCVTHDVAETADFDRILVVSGGRVVEDGAPAELAARGGLYRKLADADRSLRRALWMDLGCTPVALDAGTTRPPERDP